MSGSEQLEREAEACRAQIADTLEELRRRAQPREIANRVVDYLGEGEGARMVGNLRRQAVDNPLPLTLVAAGIGWLMLAGRNGGKRRTGNDSSDSAAGGGRGMADAMRRTLHDGSDAAQQAGAATGDAMRAGADRLREGLDRARDFASTAYDSTSSTYESSRDAAAEKVASLRRSSSALRTGVTTAGRDLAATLRDYPLVLAGLGLAFGAAIGAALPSTDTEDELMGQASDAFKDQTREAAGEQIDKAKTVASHVIDQVEQEAPGLGAPKTQTSPSQGENVTPGAADTGSSPSMPGAAPLVPTQGDEREHQFDPSRPPRR